MNDNCIVSRQNGLTQFLTNVRQCDNSVKKWNLYDSKTQKVSSFYQYKDKIPLLFYKMSSFLYFLNN